jgi:capsular exopolysaccharide synthesis family protein
MNNGTFDNADGQLARTTEITVQPDLSYGGRRLLSSHPRLRQEEESPLLLAYWAVLVKRRWLILSLLTASLAVTAVVTWNVSPTYRATLKLQIDPEQPDLLPFKSFDPGGAYAQGQEYLQTQFKILSSNSLAERVIKVLDLSRNPDFTRTIRPAFMSKTANWIWERTLGGEAADTGDPAEAGTASNPDRERALYTEKFLENLAVSPVRNSRLVHVNFESSSPELAARVLNCLAEQYIELGFETKYRATNKASEFVSRQLDELKASVERSEEGLVNFSKQHDIYSVGDKENVILQKLSELNAALTAAQAERIHKESNWKIVQHAKAGTFPEALRTDLIRELESNVATLRRTQAKLAASFKPGWPELDQVSGQLAEGENQLEAEYRKTIARVETEYFAAQEKERLLTLALEAQKGEASRLYQNSIEYNIRKREVDTNKQLYDGLLEHLKTAGVAAGLKSSNVHVVDPAETPGKPFRPNKALNLALALAIGLLLGIGAAFSLEHLDRSIWTSDDLEHRTGLTALGVIPALASLRRGSRRTFLPRQSNRLIGPRVRQVLSIDLITHDDARSLISEAYRNLRTSIQLSSGAEGAPRTVLITSSFQQEGKTATAINLAATLAQAGQRVILLDCDMRNPRMHRAVGVDGTTGMSGYLSGQTDLGAIIRPSRIANLYCVSAGQIPPNPAELIGSHRMREGLAALGAHFDQIIIDSPPLLPVTDARILSTLVDAVVLVIRAGSTPRGAVLQSKHLLEAVHAPLFGGILNNVDLFSPDYYRYSVYYRYVDSYGMDPARSHSEKVG